MRGAIFDLDGTLADTAADLLGAANAVLAPRGLPLLELARDKPFAGRGARSMIHRSLALMEAPLGAAAAEAIADDLYPGFLRAYEGRLADQTRLYDGVLGCLDALAAAGWRLGVCTNKPERLAVMLLDRLGVLERFGAVLGADSLAVRKPDPEHLRETALRCGARPDRCVMLGRHADRCSDRPRRRGALCADQLRLLRRAAGRARPRCGGRPFRRDRPGCWNSCARRRPKPLDATSPPRL